MVRALTFAYYTIGAATRLHNDVFWKVTRAPTSFFDTTPTGRILNRFSKDQDQIDDLLPDSLLQTLQYVLLVLSTLILISIVLPWFSLCLIPFFILFWVIGNYYRKSARDLKRLDGITRSPIVEHLSATLQGLSIIRAYNAEKRFYDKEVELIDCNHKCFFGFEMAARWLGWRLDFMAAGVVIATGIFILVLKNVITASLGGLVLTYALQMAGVFQWSVRSMAETESLMTSVERLVHYTKNIQSEAPQIIPTNRPPAHWPDKGEIIYKDVDVRYRENAEPALQGISFHVNPKEKIGIVGRTGSGKTTLAMTLFRIVELNRGKIIIDGYDISKIGLTDLRSKLAIIPQEPVLFIGTIRSNLDPFSQYSEQQLWDTLERVHLKELVMELPGKLEAAVRENGENFSVGQRQLICIARALIRDPKVLVLDEATASIDIETDELIQKTIRKSFANCTVLTIAHRLNTIIDSDKVMVLDKGRLIEFDTPQNLLQNEDSMFSKLIEQTGAQTAKYLRDIAFGRAKLFRNVPHQRNKTKKKTQHPYKKKLSNNRRKSKSHRHSNKRRPRHHNSTNKPQEGPLKDES